MGKLISLGWINYIILLISIVGTLQSYSSLVESNMYNLVESALEIDEFKSNTEGNVSLETLYASAELAIATAAQQSTKLRQNSVLGLIIFPVIFLLSLYVRKHIALVEKAAAKP